MSNEITQFVKLSRDVNSVIAFCEQEAFQVADSGGSIQLWELTKPVANVYNFDDSAYAQAYGDYTGSTAINFTMTLPTATTYAWTGDDGSSGSGVLSLNAIRIGSGIFFRFNRIDLFQGLESWTWSIVPFVAATDGGYHPWSIAPHLSSVWFVNECNKVKWLNGSTVNNMQWSITDVPMGRHAVLWMGKLFISEPNYMGTILSNGLMWSDTYDYTNFDTKLSVNEADQYQFDTVFNLPDSFNGCTGLAALGNDNLLFYTSGAIWQLNYIGMQPGQPWVMQRKVLSSKVGSLFPYGMVASTSAHTFIGADNFYVLDGSGQPKQIGDRVWAGFQADLSEDVNLRYKTRGYLDVAKREVWWCYCSKNSTGDFDRKVGYNYISDTWQFADANEHAFLHTRISIGTNPLINETELIINANTLIINSGGAVSLTEQRFFGCADRVIQVESSTPTIPMSDPFLETADIIYDPAKMVDLDGMDIHAEYDGATCQGVRVEYSNRNNISEGVVWKQVPKLWFKNLAGTRYGYPRARGRIFRFRFTFVKAPGAVAVLGAKFYFWNEFVRGLQNDADDK